jgi:hypothetical protein
MNIRSRLLIGLSGADTHPHQANVRQTLMRDRRFPKFPIVFYQLKYPFPLGNQDTMSDGIEADFRQRSNAAFIALLEDF